MWKEQDKIRYFQFSNLQKIPSLKHAVFSRQGGFSKPPYDSLNASVFQGDDPKHVALNHAKIMHALGLDSLITHSLVMLEQTHGVTHQIIDKKVKPGVHVIGQGDALITNQKGVGLLACHADCQIAFFFDSFKKVIAITHAGWRGQVQNIYAKTVEQLVEKFDVDPKNLLVGISPSLGPCHAEFKNYEKEFPKEFFTFMISNNHFDLWALAVDQLEKAGVQKKHIEVARLCTFDESQDFFSYRRSPKTGRNASVIALV